MPTANETMSVRSAVSNIMRATEEFLGDCEEELKRNASARQAEAAAFVKELRRSARVRMCEHKSARASQARSTRDGLVSHAAEIQREATRALHDARMQLKSVSEARLAAAIPTANARATVQAGLAKASRELRGCFASDRLRDTQNVRQELHNFSKGLREGVDAIKAAHRRALGVGEARFQRSRIKAAAKRRVTGTLAAVDYTIAGRPRPAA